jgi:hypothetical protein
MLEPECSNYIVCERCTTGEGSITNHETEGLWSVLGSQRDACRKKSVHSCEWH